MSITYNKNLGPGFAGLFILESAGNSLRIVASEQDQVPEFDDVDRGSPLASEVSFAEREPAEASVAPSS